MTPAGRDVSSPAIWATKISAHFSNVAQMSRRLNGQVCSHTPSALNAGAKRSGATCHMAMPQCCYLGKGAKQSSHTTNMLTSSNVSVNWSIWSTHLVDTFVAHVTDTILSPKWLVTKCPWSTPARAADKKSNQHRKQKIKKRDHANRVQWTQDKEEEEIT